MKLKGNSVLVVVLFMLFMGCNTSNERSIMLTHIPNGNSWSEVFSEPQEIFVDTWNTGLINVAVNGVINTKHKDSPKFQNKHMYADVPIYYIRSECSRKAG